MKSILKKVATNTKTSLRKSQKSKTEGKQEGKTEKSKKNVTFYRYVHEREYEVSPNESLSSRKSSSNDYKKFIQSSTETALTISKNKTMNIAERMINKYIKKYENLEPIQHGLIYEFIDSVVSKSIVSDAVISYVKTTVDSLEKREGFSQLTKNSDLNDKWKNEMADLYGDINIKNEVYNTILNQKITDFMLFRNQLSRTLDIYIKPVIKDHIVAFLSSVIKSNKYSDFVDDIDNAIEKRSDVIQSYAQSYRARRY